MGILQGLVANNGHLYAMWKGIPNDDRLFYSSWSGSGNWTPQVAVAGNTSHGPALGAMGGHVYAAWKGEWSDFRLWFNKLNGTTWTAQAQIPNAYSDVGPALAGFGTHLVAAWKHAWDQGIHYAIYNGTSWSAPAQIPGVATSVGPSLATFNNKLYAAWKGENNDQGIWYASYNGTNWSAQAEIPGVATSVGPSLAVLGNKLYAVWKGENNDNGLWYASFDGTHWSAQAQLPGGSSNIGAAIATLGNKIYGIWRTPTSNSLTDASFDGTHWSAIGNHIAGNTGQDPLGALVPNPGAGLGSNSNYILYSNNHNLTGVSASVWITEDIASSNGFGFQLNCYCPSPVGDSCAWQQFCFVVQNNTLSAIINNWPVNWKVNGKFVDVILEWMTLQSLSSNKLAAGYQLTVTLENDAHANITGARFVVVDNHGVVQANISKTLLGFNFPGFTAADQKPINGFEMNLVGPDDGSGTTLTSGKGIFVFSAAQPLTALNHEPAGDLIIGTAETANSVYSQLPPAYGNGAFCQLFAAGSTLQPMIKRAGLHTLRKPEELKVGKKQHADM